MQLIKCCVLGFAAILLLTSSIICAYADKVEVNQNLLTETFESGTTTYNPWAGVDDHGNLRVWTGNQLAVNDDGNIQHSQFSPSVAIGDLNGDGLPDLVVADPRGFFWFYPNSGKVGAPVFTTGEVMPIWLGEDRLDGDVVPRIQLIDYDGDGKLDLVAGDYEGKLYLIHNSGTPTNPEFGGRSNEHITPIDTHTNHTLWCNYLAPCLTDWSKTGRLDLIMGEGSYSANSIYLFINQGSNDHPVFNEKAQIKIIPGMGREHLTPQAVHWRGAGGGDILAGERAGYINIYVNKADAAAKEPSYDCDNPEHVHFGNTEKIGDLTTVGIGDLNSDKHFDLILGDKDGRILYSLNSGDDQHPQFGLPSQFKGVNPYPKITLPKLWHIERCEPYGAAFELLECINPKTEPGLTLPEGTPDPGVMKFSLVPQKQVYFPTAYVPENNMRKIHYGETISLETDTRYTLSFWVRIVGDVTGLTWTAEGWQRVDNQVHHETFTGSEINTSGEWIHAEQEVYLPSQTELKKDKVPYYFKLCWYGNGSIYFNDIQLTKKN